MENKCLLDKSLLKKYGKVEKCEESNGQFHVKITEGFSVNMKNTMSLMSLITDSVSHKYDTVVKCITDTNIFELVLKPKK